jgi:hypothetical protein
VLPSVSALSISPPSPPIRRSGTSTPVLVVSLSRKNRVEAALTTCSRIPWPAWTGSVDAPAASAPGACGEPPRAPTFLPFVSTVWPSLTRPLVALVCVAGMSPCW